MEYQDGRYVLAAVPKDASAKEVSIVQQQIARSNALISQFRELAAKSEGKVHHAEGSVGTLVFGEDKIVYRWNGLDWYMSHDTTQAIVYALNMGQGIMAILAILVALIPPHGPAAAVALAIAIALFQMGADTLDYYDNGRGVIVGVRYGFFTGIRSQ